MGPKRNGQLPRVDEHRTSEFPAQGLGLCSLVLWQRVRVSHMVQPMFRSIESIKCSSSNGIPRMVSLSFLIRDSTGGFGRCVTSYPAVLLAPTHCANQLQCRHTSARASHETIHSLDIVTTHVAWFHQRQIPCLKLIDSFDSMTLSGRWSLGSPLVLPPGANIMSCVEKNPVFYHYHSTLRVPVSIFRPWAALLADLFVSAYVTNLSTR